jgi:hydroxycarboxylate dehydrogenase B
MLVEAETLQELATQICLAMGARPEDAARVARCLVDANLCGYDSHGVYRLGQYHDWWRQGLLCPAARPQVAAETPVAAQVDGGFGFGQVVAAFAAEVARAKASVTGLAVVTARRSNHVGRLADAAETLRGAGLVGLVMVNDSGAGQAVVPWGAVEGRLSTNPIAVGIPGGAGPGILFDFSTSAAASGKVRQLLLRGETTPPGWLIDAGGQPTTDPAALFTDPPGHLLPAGGHRGYALSLLVEVLAGILSGAGAVRPDPGPEEMNGLFVLALNPGAFLPIDRFRDEVDHLTAYVASARPVPGGLPVHVPGQASQALAAARRRDGIPLNQATWETLAKLLVNLRLPPSLLPGG